MDKYYSKTHEWVKVDGDEAIIGISEFAARELGDATYVELPKEGSDIILGDTVASIESVRASSDVYSPISGTIVSVNKALGDDPEIINSSPEERGWICKLENIDLSEIEELMEEADYRKYLKSL